MSTQTENEQLRSRLEILERVSPQAHHAREEVARLERKRALAELIPQDGDAIAAALAAVMHHESRTAIVAEGVSHGLRWVKTCTTTAARDKVMSILTPAARAVVAHALTSASFAKHVEVTIAPRRMIQIRPSRIDADEARALGLRAGHYRGDWIPGLSLDSSNSSKIECLAIWEARTKRAPKIAGLVSDGTLTLRHLTDDENRAIAVRAHMEAHERGESPTLPPLPPIR
ncbi:MAG: hypothetical protein KIT31_18585 [Deltaproteobacteria bacterium]|nr:hypothetical protein [Deltaproteobacteria bacterium]